MKSKWLCRASIVCLCSKNEHNTIRAVPMLCPRSIGNGLWLRQLHVLLKLPSSNGVMLTHQKCSHDIVNEDHIWYSQCQRRRALSNACKKILVFRFIFFCIVLPTSIQVCRLRKEVILVTSYTKTTAWTFRQQCSTMDLRKRSWPAVSHTCTCKDRQNPVGLCFNMT